MLPILLPAEETLLLSGDGKEQERSGRQSAELFVGARHLQQRCRSGSVVHSAVVDFVAVDLRPDSEVIPMRCVYDVGILQLRIASRNLRNHIVRIDRLQRIVNGQFLMDAEWDWLEIPARGGLNELVQVLAGHPEQPAGEN